MLRVSSLALLLVSSALSLVAQDFRATIFGQVTDQSGAAISGAKVRAVQRNTNEAKEVVTNQDGYYTFSFLQPSTYDIDVVAPGFHKAHRENVTLLVADKQQIPFKLEVGQMNTEVTVVADSAEIIQTGDASGGLNFDSLMTSEYALNGRQVYMLMDLTPGVLFGQEDFGATGYSGTRGWDVNDNFTMTGGVKGSNSFSLNGAPISQQGMFQLAPNVDAIQEFKVMTNTYDASLGRTGGGSVNTTLKSGSNQWHGTLFNFMRNQILDANFTQSNAAGSPRGKHITNQFGGTLGGKLKRDKHFFLLSFEGFRERVPFPAVADTPPLDLRTGQAFGAAQYRVNIYDPLSAHQCVNGKEINLTGNCDSSGIIRDPFPGSVLPESRISPIGKKILSFYPTQNVPGTADNFVYSGGVGKYRYEQPMARWDWVVDQNNRIYALFTFQAGTEFRNGTGIPGPAASGNIDTWRKNVNGIADWTRILSTSAILDVRASFGRFWQLFPNSSKDSGVTAQSLGMTGMQHAPTSTFDAPPRIAVDQYTNLFGNGTNLQTFRAENQLNFAPSITVTSGKKTLHFGADILYAGRGTGDIGLANGYLQFTKWGTQRYPRRSSLNAQDGSGVADLLLGIPGAGQIDWNDTYYRTWPYIGFFIQNDWKILPRVTLNLGLRYDVQFPWVERWDRVNAGFDYDAKNPLSDQIIAKWVEFKTAYDRTNPRFPYPNPPKAILGGKTFASETGKRRIYDTDWQNIQPRIGVAYRFERNSVLRFGFGIFHRVAGQTSQSDGFSLTTGFNRSLDGDLHPACTQTAGACQTGPYSLQNPFPDGIIQPTGSEQGLLTNVGNAVTYSGRQRPIPRSFQYSFGIQRRMPWQIRMDVKYVGSITNHDSMTVNTDYWGYDLNQAFFALPAYGNTTVNNPFYGFVPTNRTRGGSTTIARQELFRLYPLFANVLIDTQPWTRYRYDALLLQVDKRFTGDRSWVGGLTTVFAYTFSKNLQTANYLNNWNIDHEKPVHELVAYDKPQSIAFSGVWELPFGRNRHFFSHPNKVVNGVIGGWRVNWVYRYISGVPIAGINAVNKCGTLLVDDQSHDRWFNNTKGCWVGNPSFQLRVVEDRYAWLREQENITTNLAAAKTFRVTERWSFQLRGEAFNLMNRPIYRPAPTTYTDVRFGMQSIEQRNFPRNIQVSGKILF